MDPKDSNHNYPNMSSSYSYDSTQNQLPFSKSHQNSVSARLSRATAEPYTDRKPADTELRARDPERMETWMPPPSSRSAGRESLAPLHVPFSYRHPRPRIDTQDMWSPGQSPDSSLDSSKRSYDDIQRRSSVPDRSPLQKLVGKLGDISKEEKRARMEEAEHRAIERARERANPPANQSRRMDGDPSHPNAHQQSFHSHTAVKMAKTSTEDRRAFAPQDSHHSDTRLGSNGTGRGQQESGPKVHTSDSNQATRASDQFRRASEALRMHGANDVEYHSRTNRSSSLSEAQTCEGVSHAAPQRQTSRSYRHRARDAGFAGAAAAVSIPGLDGTDSGGGRRNSVDDRNAVAPTLVARDYSTSPQTRPDTDRHNHAPAFVQQQRPYEQSYNARGIQDRKARHDTGREEALASHAQTQTRSVSQQRNADSRREEVVNAHTARISQPRDNASSVHRGGLKGLLHHSSSSARLYQPQPVLDEWRHGEIAKLTAADLVLNDRNANAQLNVPRQRGSSHEDLANSYDGPSDEEGRSFRPPLQLQCGPLLRYTGLRVEELANHARSGASDREIWRGSVMIVTIDSQSSYRDPPKLRLFAQPKDLATPHSIDVDKSQSNHNDQPVDLVAGQVKLSRTGKPVYVKPVDQIHGGIDVSRTEGDAGLFQSFKSPLSAGERTGEPGRAKARTNASRGGPARSHWHDGEKAGRYREIRATRPHAENGVTFWRFNMEIELASCQTRVAYRINQGPAVGFWVPAKGESMNVMFHSCNGFSLVVDPNIFSGPDPLWRDVLNKHQSKPFHVMLGGGDQIYNDAATRDTELFKEWLHTKIPEHKYRAEFSGPMQAELESFYLNRYSMWFSQGLFGLANSQIPMVNIWDDHDIIDGFGSYPHRFMSTKVFTGLGAVAFKYYMLFQHQSVVAETQREEPSWLLGASPGPYIHERSRSVFMFLGRKIAFLGLDCRTERMRDEVLSQESYDIAFDRCRAEIIKGETKHLLVLLGVPIAYPRLNFLENILTSRIMDPIKAIGRTGVLGGFVNKFDGGVEILDDLDDHWTAKHHKAERNWFIQELQELAAEKSVRVTILGGDVHLGAVGQFYTKRKQGVAKDRDHRYMPNVISSAIVNTPPPNLMSDVLNRRNKVHHLDAETDEDMIPMFEEDVDGRPRNNLHLLPRRNYCTIREYIPGSTPPSSPRLATPDSLWGSEHDDDEQAFPPEPMRRTLSLNRSKFRPANIVRRLSGSRAREEPTALARDQGRPYKAYNVDTNHFRPKTAGNPMQANQARPNFARRPTDLSEKRAIMASARGGPQGNIEGHEPGHIDLEGGLDISLNMEIDQKDPAGLTRSYRLLVPALWYEGRGDPNTARFKSRGASLVDRIRGMSKSQGRQGDYSDSETEESRESLESDTDMHRRVSTGRRTPGPNRSTQPHGTDGASQQKSWFDSGRHDDPAAQLPPQESNTARRSSTGQPGFRRATNDDSDGFYDDDSFTTESDLSSGEVAYEQRQRRPSKTDEFFGINDGAVKQAAPRRRTGNEAQVESKEGKRWKLWR